MSRQLRRNSEGALRRNALIVPIDEPLLADRERVDPLMDDLYPIVEDIRTRNAEAIPTSGRDPL